MADHDHLDILGDLEELDSLDEMSLLGDLMGLAAELEEVIGLDDITPLEVKDDTCRVCNYIESNPAMADEFTAWLWETGGDKSRLYNTEYDFEMPELWRHWRYHYRAQPSPKTRILGRDAWAYYSMLTPRQKEIIRCVGRARMVTTVMVAQLFYARRKTLKRHHLDQANKDLTYLASRHYLYRYRTARAVWNEHMGSTVWYLGKAGAKVLETEYDETIRPGFYMMRETDVKPLQLPHDLTANWLFARAAMQLDGHSFGGGTWIVNPQNWFGARQLHLGYMDPYHYIKRDNVPDGLVCFGWEKDLATGWMATLSDQELEDLSSLVDGLDLEKIRKAKRDFARPVTDQTSALLPLFLEYDRGSKKAYVVADQVLAYAYIASSNVVSKLLPQVGGMVPCVMVFRSRTKLSAVRKIIRQRLKSLRDRGVTDLWAPVYLTTEDLWNTRLSDGKILVHAWHGTKAVSLGDLLFAENQAALSSLQLHARSIMQIDKEASKGGQIDYRELPARKKNKPKNDSPEQ